MPNTQNVTIDTAEGSFNGYLALPDQGSGPGIVVIQEIFGINGFMRAVTENLANQGFVALCPDLFWRIEPGIELTDQKEDELQRAFDLFGQFDVEKGIQDVASTIDFLRSQTNCTGKVGTVGFCLGGFLAYLSATRTSSDASVGYYGVSIQDKLSEAKNIQKPLMLHIAGNDDFVPQEAQEKINAELKDNPLITLHTYEGLGHAFARNGGDHYNQEQAQIANGRTLDFFKSNLS